MATEHDFAPKKMIYAHTGYARDTEHLNDYDKTDQQFNKLTGRTAWSTVPGLDTKVVAKAEHFLENTLATKSSMPQREYKDVVVPQIDYYDAGGQGAIEYIKAKLSKDEYRGFLMGNVLKYVSRMSHKGQAASDAKKLAVYSKWLEEVTNDSK